MTTDFSYGTGSVFVPANADAEFSKGDVFDLQLPDGKGTYPVIVTDIEVLADGRTELTVQVGPAADGG